MDDSYTPPTGSRPGDGTDDPSTSTSLPSTHQEAVRENESTSLDQPANGPNEEVSPPRQHPEPSPSSSFPSQSRLGQAMSALLQSFASLPPGGGGSNSGPVDQVPASAAGTPAASQGHPSSESGPTPALNSTIQSGTTLTIPSDARPVIFRPPTNLADAHRIFAELIRTEGTEAAVSHHQLQEYQEQNPHPGHHPIAGPPVPGIAILDQNQSQGGDDTRGGARPTGNTGGVDSDRVGGDRQPGGGMTPPNMYYQLPFYALDGRQALLALPALFLPRQIVSPTLATLLVPGNPIYVPRSASHLPFSVLMDGNGMAWPLLDLQHPPPGTPDVYLNDARRPHFIAGPPFILAGVRVSMMPEEQEGARTSPEKAKAFVDTLETADAELRERMARLSIGDIGIFSGSGGAAADTEAGHSKEGELGCPVCLDPYDESSDRPEWLGGETARENQVVVIPCPGFHSMHRKCLVEWLSSRAPSTWSCPMCRTSISPGEVVKGTRSQQQHPSRMQSHQQPAPTQASLAREIEARAHTLREEIHRRERQVGFTCDYQACFPDYEARSSNADQDEAGALDRQMIKLQPCGHELHLECLTTSLRVENDLKVGEDDCDDVDADDVDGNDDEDEEENKGGGTAIRTVGKWVTCPVDKREVWAKIPVLRRKREASQLETSLGSEKAQEVGGEAADTMESGQEGGQRTGLAEEEENKSGCGQIHRLSHSPTDMPGAKRQVLEPLPPGKAEVGDQGTQGATAAASQGSD